MEDAVTAIRRQAAGVEPPKPEQISEKIAITLAELHTKPIPTQMGIGGGVGLITGYLFTRGSKATAAILGGSLLVFQFACYKGYVEINQTKVKGDLRSFAEGIEKRLSGKRRIKFSKDVAADYLTDNSWLIGGFAAGWLIGYSLA